MSIELRATINKDELARANRLLERLEWKASKIDVGLRRVGIVLLRQQNRRFKAQQDPDGKPWTKLAPLTVALRGGKKGPILNRSGDLKNSGAFAVSGRALSVGVNTPYAAAQQYGVTIKPKNKSALAIPFKAGFDGSNAAGFVFAKSVTIPPRRIVGFGEKDEQATERVITKWLSEE